MRNLLLVWFAAVTLLPAQSDKRVITLTSGRGELLRFPADVPQVAASEPKIADVVVISPREVMVNAKEAGHATVIVWQGDNPFQYDINVLADTADFEAFRQSFNSQLEGANIEMTGKGDTIVLTGTAKDAAQVKRAAALAQTRAKTVVNLVSAPPAEPQQIVLQVKFASIDRTALKQIGFNLFSTNNTLVGTSSTEQFQPPRLTQLVPGGTQSVNFADLMNLFVYRPDINLGATIRALEEKDLLQILAEPNLITTDGKAATFIAGGSFPFPVLQTTSTGGAVSPVVTVQFKPFGVQLDFTPTVTEAGSINLKVAPEVSSLDYSNAVTLQGFLIPALSQRRAETEVILKDGESFAIAGLIDNRVTETIDKMPGLGSIPILGQLFSSRSTKKTNTELLVVVTPHFVKPLKPGEKAPMPEFPSTFLPDVLPRTDKNGKTTGDFVGPRGHQEPKPEKQ
jgi:pilus assembly protein CpaC